MKGLGFLPSVPLSCKASYLRTRCRPSSTSVAPRRSQHCHTIALVSLDQESAQRVFEAVSPCRLEKLDGFGFLERAERLASTREVPSYIIENLKVWHKSYGIAVANNKDVKEDPNEYTEAMFSTLLELCRQAIETPIDFSSYHQRIREPFDHYKFGFDFSSVLLNRSESSVIGIENVAEAENYVKQGHNVIFLSNHQSEGDPYAIDVMLDWIAGCSREFCEDIVFMAGDRVRNDPMVSPFSAGRNLLTVYSKKHMNDQPELREHKLMHNRRTISETQKLFKEGGQALWFAPSGGRDRRSEEMGSVQISSFDEGAVDMMKFTAMKSGKPFHFYPMALWTYDMLPPPTNVGGAKVGEERVAKYTPMHMYIGKEIDWSSAVPPDVTDKIGRRRAQCKYIEDIVIEGYRQIGGYER
ncbi:Glycerol-3-phosphate acyltransferase, chloroplastic [Gracilariopsis chorda]|uniref:Glycerol-3-phosphate acyltransferase, chloroplastic n=1 Tax=Gracilariopsis chorda TaxID=448386 RepID=A0A2V3IZG0_9FLOR|nr:Glycerol-3-phosphate acyltransferase, chloroplastic [Gracilariopsis chorda]|eukprot:PXF47528.1 Glycerol-3-phosphate acyltransferase, chloroplastic [Gracilariopsis chorda]